jgi:hypothetical protein
LLIDTLFYLGILLELVWFVIIVANSVVFVSNISSYKA